MVNAKGTARGWVRPSQHAQAPAARLRALASSNARKRSKTHRLVRKLSRSSSCGNNDNLSGLRSCWGGAQVVEVVAGGAADGTRALRYRLDASSAEDFSPNDWLHLASEAAGRSRWEGTHTHTIHTHTHHIHATHIHIHATHTQHTHTHTQHTHTHTHSNTQHVSDAAGGRVASLLLAIPLLHRSLSLGFYYCFIAAFPCGSAARPRLLVMCCAPAAVYPRRILGRSKTRIRTQELK